MIKTITILFLCFFYYLLVASAFAVDFGKRGTSFDIYEEGFLEMIARKLNRINLAAENEKMEKIAKNRIINPAPVPGIQPAIKDREFYFDLTYVVTKDVKLPDGETLYKAGTSVNPLDYTDFDRRLYLIDARVDKQIKWLKSKLANNENHKLRKASIDEPSKFKQKAEIENRIILIGGSPLKLEEELGQKIYFDQAGEITSKTDIRATPAILEQEGKMIRIREIALTK